MLLFGKKVLIVESVGEEVEEVKARDLVIPVFRGNCGECKDCKSQETNYCSKFATASLNIGMPRDGTSRFIDSNGQQIYHFLCASTFSEYTVVDIAHIVKINPDFPIDKACLLSCGVTTGLGAAIKFAQVQDGSTVAIFGLGTIGLAVAEGARFQGASRIIGVDINPEKFEIGKKFGEKSVSQVIQEMTNGGADYCFECIGLASIMEDAFNSSQMGYGKTVLIGVEMHGTPLSINTHEILRGRSLTGCLFGGLKPKSDLPILANKYLEKRLQLDDFITHEVKLEDINKAFQLLNQGKSLRCIIWMDK